MRRSGFVRQHVVRRQMCDAASWLARHCTIKPAHGLEHHLGALIGFHDQNRGASKLGRCDRGDKRFSGIGEAGQTDFTLAAPERIQRLVDFRIPRDAGKNFRDQRQNHARSCLMRSIKREVEWPGSGGMCTTATRDALARLLTSTALLPALALLPSTKISGAKSSMNFVAGASSPSSTATSTA